MAAFLFCSPAAALRMLVTARYANLLAAEGEWVRARLGMQRRTPPQPIELTRPLVVRKAETSKPPLPFDRAPHETSWSADSSSAAPPRPVRLARGIPDTSPPLTPQQRRIPPPDPLSHA